MKKLLFVLFGLAALAAVGLLGALTFFRPAKAPEWTTDSPRALEAYQSAIDAGKKRYWADAGRHLERALELDPDFAMARIESAMMNYGPMSPKVGEVIDSLDRSALNEREAALVSFLALHLDGKHDEAKASLDRYLDEHPKDPYARNTACRSAWLALSWDEAEACYQELVDRHPNWVEGQNRLGYIAMARGRFDQAAERFEAYRYVAPDQAQPHDSVGELAMLRGRYDDAAAAFARALEMKPDYCSAYHHRMQLEVFDGRGDAARATLAEVTSLEACHEMLREGLECYVELQIAFLEGDMARAWEKVESCEPKLYWSVLPHRTALLEGQLEAARAIEARLADQVEASASATPLEHRWMRSLALDMEGGRLLADGDFEGAIERLEKADGFTYYWGDVQWATKLFVRTDWLVALERAGRREQAAALRAEIDAVNPRFLPVFEPLARRLGTPPVPRPTSDAEEE